MSEAAFVGRGDAVAHNDEAEATKWSIATAAIGARSRRAAR